MRRPRSRHVRPPSKQKQNDRNPIADMPETAEQNDGHADEKADQKALPRAVFLFGAVVSARGNAEQLVLAVQTARDIRIVVHFAVIKTQMGVERRAAEHAHDVDDNRNHVFRHVRVLHQHGGNGERNQTHEHVHEKRRDHSAPAFALNAPKQLPLGRVRRILFFAFRIFV